MAKQRSSFAKLQRDKVKREKSAERLEAKKRRSMAKRGVQIPEADTTTEEAVEPKEVSISDLVSGEGEPSPDELLRIVEDLNRRKEAGTISLDEFEEAKIELFARLDG